MKCGDPDNDKDGYREVDGDCDDANKLIFPGPGAKEKCGDFVDQNCDGYEKVCVEALPLDIFERVFPEIEKPGGSWAPIGAWTPMGLENLRKTEQWVASLISTLTTVASVILSARTERSAVRRNKTIREANTLPVVTTTGSEGSQYENNTAIDRVAFTTPSTLGVSSSASTDQYAPAKQNSSKIGFSTTTVALYYTFGDHLGSSSVTLDASGNLVQVTDYFPYGGTNVDEKYGSFAQPYTYTGKELDSEVDLYYYGARYYNAGFSRFTSVDPALFDPQHLLSILADPQSLNSYAYARNNPMSFKDSDGRIIETAWDVGNTVYDIGRVIKNAIEVTYDATKYIYAEATDNQEMAEEAAVAIEQDTGELKEALIDTTIDAVSTAIPAVPAGTTKAVRAIDEAVDVTNTVKKVDDIHDGTKVYRVYGDKAAPYGESWTRVDPTTVENYRDAAGLPDSNSGRFVIEGNIKNADGIEVTTAKPYKNNTGGIDEIKIPDAQNQVDVTNVKGLNPKF